MARIISAALVSRASHNAAQGRRFLTAHRMLVAHTLKRSAGIGHVEDEFSESVAELADSFVVMILVTGFLEVSFSPFFFLFTPFFFGSWQRWGIGREYWDLEADFLQHENEILPEPKKVDVLFH